MVLVDFESENSFVGKGMYIVRKMNLMTLEFLWRGRLRRVEDEKGDVDEMANNAGEAHCFEFYHRVREVDGGTDSADRESSGKRSLKNNSSQYLFR